MRKPEEVQIGQVYRGLEEAGLGGTLTVVIAGGEPCRKRYKLCRGPMDTKKCKERWDCSGYRARMMVIKSAKFPSQVFQKHYECAGSSRIWELVPIEEEENHVPEEPK